MKEFTVWKVRHKAGDNPDYFSFSIRRGEEYPITFTWIQFNIMFPEVNTSLIPEAPRTTIMKIQGIVE